MPLYPYKCQSCGTIHEPYRSILDELPVFITCECGGRMRRHYTPPAFHRFHEHFNTSVGSAVSSDKEFKTKLYEAQEKMTERLGFQQHYAPAETRQIVNDEGMKSTHDHRKKMGMST